MSSRRTSLSVACSAAIALGLCWATLTVAKAQDAAPEEESVLAPQEVAASAPAEETIVLTEPEAPAEDAVASPSAPQMTNGVISQWSFQNLPIRQVLRVLAIYSQKNIIASKNVQGDISADLYDVTVREALDALLKVNGFDYVAQGSFIYVYTAEELEAIRQAQRQMAVRVFPLFYVRPEDAQLLIGPALSEEGTVAVTPDAQAGIATSATDTGGQSYATGDVLVVRDYEENLDRIGEILRNVDRRPQQVLIEATIVRATLNENNALGIDFNTLAGVNFSQLGATTGGLTNVRPELSTEVADLDANQATLRTDFNTTIGSGGFSFGYIGSDVAVFLRALEGVTDSQVLANPKVLVVNRMRGEVLVGRRDGYLTTTVTQTTATQTVEFLETGTRLVLRPYIGDNGYIRMEVHPEDSSGTVANGLPTQQTTECTSNILVKDGHTVIIGGLFREITTQNRSQVPLLGNIPYAGVAFRSTQDITQREEVIILLTPHIIRDAADDAVSAELLADVERFRMGMRQNLAWFGRDRLAAAHLRWAKEHLAAGRRDKALWDLNMALSLSPKMHEALLLKERLTNEATWAHEPRYSSVRWTVERMVMQDLGMDPGMVMTPCKPADAAALPPQVRDAFGMQPMTHEPLDWVPCEGPVVGEAPCPPPAEPIYVEPVEIPMVEDEDAIPEVEAGEFEAESIGEVVE